MFSICLVDCRHILVFQQWWRWRPDTDIQSTLLAHFKLGFYVIYRGGASDNVLYCDNLNNCL
jgi:hypothetical protein